MRRALRFLLLLTALAILPGGAADAQDGAVIDSIEVALWPEYDKPSVLGLYLVRLDSDEDLPATVRLPLPEGVRSPLVVAAWFPDGRLDDSIEWQVEDDEGTAIVSTVVETTGVWMEFYAPLDVTDDLRAYSFIWPGGVSARSFNFEIMHPVGAVQVDVRPEGQVAVGDDGLTYSRLDLGVLGVDDRPGVELQYERPEVLPSELGALPVRTTDLAALEVALWPEFDRQETLVIYRAQLHEETELPTTVTLPIPIEAGEPHAVATIGDDLNLYVAPYELERMGTWSLVHVESDSRLLQIEFYLDLTIADDRRSFAYYWPGGVDIETFQFEVQRPPSASAFQVTPAAAVQPGLDGLTYLRGTLGPKGVGDEVLISLAYDKSDDRLSLESVSSQPALDRPATTQGGTPDLAERLPIILAGFGVLLVAVGVFAFLRTRAGRTPRSKPRRRRRARQGSDDKLESSPIYCHVCGSQANASDHFCRRCGTKLRN